jgi:hypothetical protein
MNLGAQALMQHKAAIDRDTAIRLANARKNAEAIGRQRRYNQAMASEQADRDLKERMHAQEMALKSQELEAAMHPFDRLLGQVIERNGRRAKRVPVRPGGAVFKIHYDPRT